MEPSIPLNAGSTIPYHSLLGDIEFCNVSFAYPTRPEQDILKNFNLKIPAGQVIAFCGPSGGGNYGIKINKLMKEIRAFCVCVFFRKVHHCSFVGKIL